MIRVPAAAEKNIKSATVRSKSLPLAGLSGVLLFLSYPPFSLGFLAWFALVPLFFALPSATSRRKAFFLGTFSGLVFFLISLQWLTHVTAVGWFLLASFEALFIGLFALCVYESSAWRMPLRILWGALAWTATEFLRAKFPVLGLGWNLLGYSQAFYETVVQSANVFGVYGLGFGIVIANFCVYLAISDKRQAINKKSLIAYPLSLIAVIVILITSHGVYHKNKAGDYRGDFRISLIQGNIPQSVKWEAMARNEIIEIYMKLTELAAFEEPSLIIWPEAAFPGYFNRDFDAQLIKELVQKIEIPVLVGAPAWEIGDKAYNSAFLLEPSGKMDQRYDKQNLVPFGEYVPMPALLGWLAPYAYAMGVSDFSAGREKTVFKILNDEVAFSVLICFEDVFPELARQFVGRGAEFLAVITNDAWFGKTGAPVQHLQVSIFRAVENGVPVVRAANTGVSAFISNRGKVLDTVADEKGEELFVTGRKTMALPIDVKKTLFGMGGWAFPYAACFVFVVMFAFFKNSAVRDKR